MGLRCLTPGDDPTPILYRRALSSKHTHIRIVHSGRLEAKPPDSAASS